MPWLPRFGLHLAAAVGAAGVFVLAAAAGANQARPQPTPPPAVTAVGTPRPERTPRVIPERSVAGSVRETRSDGVVVDTLRGVELQVQPAPGALIRLNGKTAPLDAIQPGDTVVILGQAQPRGRFLAHAITARRPASR
jgi:hypothetical protein